MLADIGMVGGIYTFVRLLCILVEPRDEEVPSWQGPLIILAMVAIAFFTIDIFMLGTSEDPLGIQ